jgi:hypothetical protein
LPGPQRKGGGSGALGRQGEDVAQAIGGDAHVGVCEGCRGDTGVGEESRGLDAEFTQQAHHGDEKSRAHLVGLASLAAHGRLPVTCAQS